MKVKIPGYSSLTGSPETILRLMSEARWYDHLQGNDLIDDIIHTVWRAFGVGLQVTGDTYAERAESLLRELNKANMIEIEEES